MIFKFLRISLLLGVRPSPAGPQDESGDDEAPPNKSRPPPPSRRKKTKSALASSGQSPSACPVTGVVHGATNGVPPIIKVEFKPSIKQEEDFEEDCIDGFAILSFADYEELEVSLRMILLMDLPSI